MLIRHTALYLPAQIISPLSQLVAVLLWAKLLPASSVGIVTLTIAIQEIAFAGCFMWWSHYALRYARDSKNNDGSGFAFQNAELKALVLSSSVQVPCVVIVFLFFLNDHASAIEIAVAVIFVLSRSITSYLTERARAFAEIKKYSAIQIGTSLGGISLGLLLVKFHSPSAQSVFLGFIVFQLIAILTFLIRTDRPNIFDSQSTQILKAAAIFGGPIMVGALMSLVALNIPRFVVESSFGIQAVGIFAIGYGLGLRASSFAVMLVTAGAYPLVVKIMRTHGREAAYDQLRSNISLVLLVVIPTAAGLISLTTSVVRILIPAQYEMITNQLLPIATICGMLKYARSHTTDQLPLINESSQTLTWMSLFDVCATVISSVIGAYHFGMIGAAFGPVFAGVILLIVGLVLAKQRFHFDFPYKNFFLVSLSATCMAIILLLLPVATHIGMLVSYVAIGAGVYLFAIGLMFRGQIFALIKRKKAA